VLRRNISYGTQTKDGTQAWDTFMSLVATTRKLGISFFEYVRDRITRTENIESLAQIIRNKTAPNLFGWSWQTELLPLIIEPIPAINYLLKTPSKKPNLFVIAFM